MTFRSKICSTTTYFLLNFLFIFLFSVALYFLPKGILPNLVYTTRAEKTSHTFFYPVLLVPLIEETVFRLWFVYSKIKLSLSISVLLPYMIFYLARYVFNTEWGNLYLVSNLASVCIIFPLIFFILKRYEDREIIFFWKKNQKKIIIISSLIFGLSHIVNYTITPSVILFSPILFLPQIFAGFIFSYTRVRIGFVAGVASHSLYNFTIYLLFILYKTS